MIADEIQALFGDPLREPPGVLHVTAVWSRPELRDDPDGALVTLRIGPDSPSSEHDFLSLSVARARCDALVSTGAILREEPDLVHTLPDAVARWRREVRGLAEPPASVVLTGRDDLDFAHPVFREGGRSIVVTGTDVAPALRARAAAERREVEIVGRRDPSLRDTLRFLRGEAGLASVCIEAGPSSSLGLYEPPLVVDELMLSEFRGAALAEGVEGGPFRTPAELARDFEERHVREVREPSGPWCFRRLVRRPS